MKKNPLIPGVRRMDDMEPHMGITGLGLLSSWNKDAKMIHFTFHIIFRNIYALVNFIHKESQGKVSHLTQKSH